MRGEPVKVTVTVSDGVTLTLRELQTAMLMLDPNRAGKVLRALAGGESAWAFLFPDSAEESAAWAGY